MESNAAEQWISTTLKADAQLTALVGTRVRNTRRLGTDIFPLVVYNLQAARRDVMGLGGVRIWAPLLYLIVGVAEQASYEGDLATIANRIDAALHAKSGTATAGTIWTCTRENVFQMPEIVDGREFRRLGGIYLVQAR